MLCLSGILVMTEFYRPGYHMAYELSGQTLRSLGSGIKWFKIDDTKPCLIVDLC